MDFPKYTAEYPNEIRMKYTGSSPPHSDSIIVIINSQYNGMRFSCEYRVQCAIVGRLWNTISRRHHHPTCQVRRIWVINLCQSYVGRHAPSFLNEILNSASANLHSIRWCPWDQALYQRYRFSWMRKGVRASRSTNGGQNEIFYREICIRSVQLICHTYWEYVRFGGIRCQKIKSNQRWPYFIVALNMQKHIQWRENRNLASDIHSNTWFLIFCFRFDVLADATSVAPLFDNRTDIGSWHAILHIWCLLPFIKNCVVLLKRPRFFM